jgi:hypothetical protein
LISSSSASIAASATLIAAFQPFRDLLQHWLAAIFRRRFRQFSRHWLIRQPESPIFAIIRQRRQRCRAPSRRRFSLRVSSFFARAFHCRHTFDAAIIDASARVLFTPLDIVFSLHLISRLLNSRIFAELSRHISMPPG